MAIKMRFEERRSMMSQLTRFTNQYSLVKTLRFGLVPVDHTQDMIDAKGIIAEDQELAENYQKMKATLDAYHADFIDSCLNGFSRTYLQNLGTFYDLYVADDTTKHSESYRRSMKKAREDLRKEIARSFVNKQNGDRFKRLFKKELIITDLPKWLSALPNDKQREMFFDDSFKNRFGYFDGYNKNRENLYSAESKTSAISFRLVDQNLPKFIDNMKVFKKIQNSELAGMLETIEKELEGWIAGKNLASMFQLDAYNGVLTQKGIDAYNVIIGGVKTETEVIKGLNGYINEYNQTHTSGKLPQMQKLFKQLLSPKEKISWLPESFTDANELLMAIAAFYDDTLVGKEGILEPLESVIKDLPKYDLSGISVRNDGSLNTLSVQIFRDFHVIRNAIENYYEKVIRPDYEVKLNKAKGEKAREKLQKEKHAYVVKTPCFSIQQLQSMLDYYFENQEEGTTNHNKHDIANCIAGYFTMEISAKVAEVKRKYGNMRGVIPTNCDTKYQLTEEDKKVIKGFLDAVLELLHFCKSLYPTDSFDIDKDSMFYGDFSPIYEQLRDIVALYDKVRNFSTQKPYSKKKIKLNFQLNGNALNGWVDSKTATSDNGTQYGGYLFRKRVGQGYDYYLGISRNTRLFREYVPVMEDERSEYERLNYKQIKDKSIYGSQYAKFGSYKEDKRRLEDAILKYIASANVPELYRSLQAYCELDGHTPSGCVTEVRKYSEQLYVKLLQDEQFSAINNELITKLKAILKDMNRVPAAEGIVEKSYQAFTEIMEDISAFSETTKIFEYFVVNQNELESALADPKRPLYLFKITNKDLAYNENVLNGKRRLNPYRHENLHTMYFKALMGGNQNVYDIGSGEVFFRPASIKRGITHAQGTPIACRNPNLEKKSVFNYDLSKDKRFSEDKYEFHLSITQNYECGKISRNYNTEVREFLKNNPDINILGVDRGENNLLYISLIDRNGTVLRDEKGQLIQYSLNDICGKYRDGDTEVEFTTPYHKLLDQREKDNREAKESWGTVGKIKELKAGYMSQVVSIISKLMVKYNAIVVLEDLNGPFMRGRQKVEKQVYQNFEKALIHKLNYLVFKDVPADEPGGLYNALQLADQFESFQKLGRQSGFIFYVPAWKTSMIDPATGFVNLLKLKYENREKSRNLIGKFKQIRYNSADDWFEFEFDYKELLSNPYGHKTNWCVCTLGKERYTWNPKKNNNKGAYEKVDVTDSIKKLLLEQSIDYQSGEDLRKSLTQIESADFYKEFLRLLKITLDFRYKDGKGKDYILSPVANANGEFFNSMNAQKNNLPLPQDADANGALNIARKGLYVLRSIDKCEDTSKWDVKLTPKEWVEFAQELCGNVV